MYAPTIGGEVVGAQCEAERSKDLRTLRLEIGDTETDTCRIAPVNSKEAVFARKCERRTSREREGTSPESGEKSAAECGRIYLGNKKRNEEM